MNWPIFIPSKGRPSCATAKHFPDAILVVEEDELEAYLEANPGKKILVLPEPNQGIAYVRNFILKHNRNLSKWFWMIDDDVSGFYQTKDKKLVSLPGEQALSQAEAILLTFPTVGQGALEYCQFAWSSTSSTRLNSYCDVCVAINVRYTSLCAYRPEMNLKEDRDFTLQVLKNGAKTLRLSKLSFRAPKNGSNKGGLYQEYQQKTKEREAVDRMALVWGKEVCEPVTKPNGRYDLKIHWRFFK